jgi:hypothetical protein
MGSGMSLETIGAALQDGQEQPALEATIGRVNVVSEGRSRDDWRRPAQKRRRDGNALPFWPSWIWILPKKTFGSFGSIWR